MNRETYSVIASFLKKGELGQPMSGSGEEKVIVIRGVVIEGLDKKIADLLEKVLPENGLVVMPVNMTIHITGIPDLYVAEIICKTLSAIKSDPISAWEQLGFEDAA